MKFWFHFEKVLGNAVFDIFREMAVSWRACVAAQSISAPPRSRRNRKTPPAWINPSHSEALPVTMAKAIQLASELNRPAQLSRNNLHPYRLKVKELRNVLRLSDQADDQEFFEKLGEVKDAIGEWHDWEELIAIASRLLDHGASCKLVKRLKVTSNSKFESALSLTNHLRSHYLKSARPNGQAKRSSVSNSVLRATSAMAEL
jgi:CHAD domain-containing protein